MMREYFAAFDGWGSIPVNALDRDLHESLYAETTIDLLDEALEEKKEKVQARQDCWPTSRWNPDTLRLPANMDRRRDWSGDPADSNSQPMSLKRTIDLLNEGLGEEKNAEDKGKGEDSAIKEGGGGNESSINLEHVQRPAWSEFPAVLELDGHEQDRAGQPAPAV
ncbi:hypothetical protein DL769_005914 [Monosporascus sp. CRB-8-3]|nr:hypothetical protein DL769_005914 [Monosporascus sp. CRB-8-3]